MCSKAARRAAARARMGSPLGIIRARGGARRCLVLEREDRAMNSSNRLTWNRHAVDKVRGASDYQPPCKKFIGDYGSEVHQVTSAVISVLLQV